MKKKIVFWFPDRRIGGGPFYLLRMAVEIAKDDNYEVFYIDYVDGYTHKIDIDTSKITFIDFKDYSGYTIFIENAILFAPVYMLHNMPCMLMDTKVLFFNWHHECLPVLQANMQFNDIELRHFMNLVYKNDAQVFCDMAHWAENNKLSCCNFSKKYVPVHINKKDSRAKINIINENVVNIGILGRLVTDKIYAVINIIECAKKIQKYSINIHIIGEGDQKNKLKPYENLPKVRLIYAGTVTGEDLDNYLCNEIDILFAMGISALEGGALALPSIIIPYSLKPYLLDKFIYLYDTSGYCVGWSISQIQNSPVKTVTFKDIINDIYLFKKKHEIGMKCLKYTSEKHSVGNSVNNLKKYLDDTSLQFSDVYKVYRNQCYFNQRKHFDIRIKSYYKIFCFITILKTVHTDRYIKFYLFGFIPLLKIKYKRN